jgi:O-antigen/teichoic acid export membrane protein
MLMIGLPSAIGLIVIAPDALAILFGAEFATEPAPLIASIAVFTMLVEAIKLYHLDIAFMLRRDNRDQIVITGLGFLVNVTGCALFIPLFGSVAAACVALATGILLAVLARHRGQHFHDMPMPLSPLFGISVGCGLMAAMLWGMGRSADILDLALRVFVAALIFGGAVYVLNVGKCRTIFRQFTRGAN